MSKTSLQQYELTFILGEKADQEAGEKKIKELKALVEKAGGTIVKEEIWGRRELAYIIKRNHNGFYVTLWMDLPKDQVKPLELLLRFDESIIRSLITKAYTEAQPGSLYPVVEEPKTEKPASSKEEVASAEEMLRRSSTNKTKKEEEIVIEEEDLLPDEERLKQLDETLEELLKDEE